MTDIDDKLVKRITTCLEEFGMPKFQDRFPAMSVIQIIKDSGYWKERPQDNNAITPLSVDKVEQAIVSHVGKGEEFNEVCNTLDLAKMICAKFGKDNNALVPLGNKMLVAKELYEICCYPDPTKWEDLPEPERDVWQTRASIFADTIGKDNNRMDEKELKDRCLKIVRHMEYWRGSLNFIPTQYLLGEMKSISQQPPKERSETICHCGIRGCLEHKERKVSLEEIEKVVAKTLKASCTCRDGRGIVCVGCFYRKDIGKAILSLINATEERKGAEYGN